MAEGLRAVLVNTQAGNRICPPLNLCSLAAAVPEADALVVDGQLVGNGKALEMLLGHEPDVVGVTDLAPTHNDVLEVAKEVKRANSQTVVVVGGKQPTIFPESVEQERSIDFWVCGEGEGAWATIVRAVAETGGGVEAMKAILQDEPGIGFRGKKVDDCLTLPPDLHEIAAPNYDLLAVPLVEYLSMHPGLEVDAERGRGCVGECTFCIQGNIPGKRVRTKRPEAIFEHEVLPLAQIGVGGIFFTDDDFTAKPNVTEELCRLIIDGGIGFSCSANVRADTFLAAEDRYGIAELFRRAGVNNFYVGLEAGSRQVQEYFKKIVAFRKMMEMLEVANAHELMVNVNLIIGSPVETMETLAETKEYLFGLRDRGLALIPNLAFYLPYPGTKSYDDAVKWDLLDPKVVEPSRLLKHRGAVIPTVELSKEQLEQFYRDFYTDFFSAEYMDYLRRRFPQTHERAGGRDLSV